jgi:hypothetical protein
MPDLRIEMAAAERHLIETGGKAAEDIGIANWRDLVVRGLIGIASGAIGRGDLFTPAEFGDGPVHVIVAAIENGRISDYCAFLPQRPQHWGLRVGDGQFLGHDDVRRAIRGHGWGAGLGTLDMLATPLAWLQADGQGCVVLDDFQHDSAFVLREVERITVPNPSFAQALRRQLMPPVRLPEIVVNGGTDAARASR